MLGKRHVQIPEKKGRKNKCKLINSMGAFLTSKDSSHGSSGLIVRIVPLEQQRPQHFQNFVGCIRYVCVHEHYSLGMGCWTGI